MSKLSDLSDGQKIIMAKMRDANGKVVPLPPSASLRSVIRRGWVEKTATGYRLAKDRIVKPTWLVEVTFQLDWELRDYMWKAVPNNIGSGCTMYTNMYDMTWEAKSKAGASRLKARLKHAIANKPKGTPRVKVTVYPPKEGM
jgi:hypothetical protein